MHGLWTGARPESAATMARTGVLLGAVGLFIFNLVFWPIAATTTPVDSRSQ